MSESLLLEVNHLSVGLHTEAGYKKAIKDISFRINSGETLVLLGESGSGKTMTALAINQLLPAVAGYSSQSQVNFKHEDLLSLSEVQMRKYRGNKIGMIFQEPMSSLNPVFTIGQQIGESYKKHTQLTSKAIKAKVLSLLDAVGIPAAKKRMNDYPHQLSGGMKQRVMIAMALAQDPQLLIADEATTALDVTTQYQVLQLLKTLQKNSNMSMLFITHDLGVAAEIAHRVAVMYNGHIIENSNKENFFNKPLHPYSQRLFDVLPDIDKRDRLLKAIPGTVPPITDTLVGCPFANRCDQAWEICHKIFPKLTKVNEHKVACHLYTTDHVPTSIQHDKQTVLKKNKSSGTILSIENVKIFYPIRSGILQRKVGEVKAVDDVSFILKKSQTLALVGESGCGKSTLGKSLLQLVDSTAGCVNYQGRNILQGKNSIQLRRDIQMIFQDPYASLDPKKTIFQSISEGMKIHGLSNKQTLLSEVDRLLDSVGILKDYKYRYPHEFSGGQRQRICIARALAVKPKIIICDEPTSGLDVSIQAQILNLLKNLQSTYELSFLFITHDISVVSYLADEVAVMYLGKIVEQGSVYQLLEDPKHPYTKILLSAVLRAKKEQKTPAKLTGEQPSPIEPPTGCYFHPRCPKAMAQCKKEYPKKAQFGENHWAACHLY